MRLTINSKIRNYDVYFESKSDFLSALAEEKNSFSVIDENVWRLYKKSLLKPFHNTRRIILPIYEERKTIENVTELYKYAIEKNAKRNLTVVSIGGGITQDVTGFFASTMYRGINWIFVPTTLLAQGDSCIGAKTSLNFKNYKNLIGTFYPPSKIYIYTGFLKTLDEINYYSGLGEIVKLSIIKGEKSIQKIEKILPLLIKRDEDVLKNAIINALKIKKEYIESDEFDTGKRNILNYGHCFGHALESGTDYAVFHGQAIIVGMMFANMISRRRGYIPTERENYIFNNILLPIQKTDFRNITLNKEKIIKGMLKDKKRTGVDLAIIISDGYSKMNKITDLKLYEAERAYMELTHRIKKNS